MAYEPIDLGTSGKLRHMVYEIYKETRIDRSLSHEDSVELVLRDAPLYLAIDTHRSFDPEDVRRIVLDEISLLLSLEDLEDPDDL